MIIYNKWYKNWRLLYVKNLLFFIGVIILSIVVNKQTGVANEWFEVYKGFKYLLIFIVFKELYSAKKNTAIIDVIFICLLFFNFLHYHNIFNFNQIVMPLYCGKDCAHLTYFGLNSAGLPAVKRMIGTMANPNDNAILFLVFMLFYLPKERWKIKDVCFFVLCLIALLACQSRTSLVAFFVIILVSFIVNRVKWYKALSHSGLIAIVMIVFFFNYAIIDFLRPTPSTDLVTNTVTDTVTHSTADTTLVIEPIPVPEPAPKPVTANYSLTLLDGSAMKSNSWTYRVFLWKEFLNQFLERPIIGHAPQKNYFYENKLYFENEYVLFLWRYGILGFIALIGFYLIPLKKIFKTVCSSEISKNTLLFIMIFAICGLANVPLTNTTLSLLFFSYLGVFYSQKKDEN
jgi:O-antigen ligase